MISAQWEDLVIWLTLNFQVVPWLELAHDQGQDLYAPQYGEAEGLPRLFKTHAWEGHCPKGKIE